jgi:hypothetical protein
MTINVIGETVLQVQVLGSNPGDGEIFHTLPGPPWGPPNLFYNGDQVSFLGVKQLVHDIDQPPPSTTKVEERVELYPYSPSRHSWPVLG